MAHDTKIKRSEPTNAYVYIFIRFRPPFKHSCNVLLLCFIYSISGLWCRFTLQKKSWLQAEAASKQGLLFTMDNLQIGRPFYKKQRKTKKKWAKIDIVEQKKHENVIIYKCYTTRNIEEKQRKKGYFLDKASLADCKVEATAAAAPARTPPLVLELEE